MEHDMVISQELQSAKNILKFVIMNTCNCNVEGTN